VSACEQHAKRAAWLTLCASPPVERRVGAMPHRRHESPWLVKLHNAFYHEATVYMVLEYMDAGSIATLVKEHPQGLRDESELASITRQMLNGLNHLHRHHHQIHRDLKPANVLRSSCGEVKITDFGISSQLDSTTSLASTFVGTYRYMAPERLSGGDYSYAADVWSLGLIVLEVAIGRFPYPQTENYFSLLRLIETAESPCAPEEGGFSDAFCEFVSLSLSKLPERRSSSEELLQHPWLLRHREMDVRLSAMLKALSLEQTGAVPTL